MSHVDAYSSAMFQAQDRNTEKEVRAYRDSKENRGSSVSMNDSLSFLVRRG